MRRRKQRVCALLGDAVKRCGHRADGIGASEQRFKRFLWCNERIKLVLRWNCFIRKAGEKNACPVVARGDAADAVHNRTGWLQQQEVSVFSGQFDDKPKRYFVKQLVSREDDDFANTIRAELPDGADSPADEPAAQQHAKSGRIHRVVKRSAGELDAPVFRMRADEQAQICVVCPYNKEQQVLFGLLHFVNLSADERLQFMNHRAKRDSVHCHEIYLLQYRSKAAFNPQTNLFRFLQAVENQSIAARAVFQTAVDAANGRAGSVELVRDVLIGFTRVKLPRNLPALRHCLQFVDGAHVFKELIAFRKIPQR